MEAGKYENASGPFLSRGMSMEEASKKMEEPVFGLEKPLTG